MAQRVEAFAVTVPAGTAIATPQTTALPFNRGVVEGIEVVVPPGPSGMVGFAVVHSGDVIIPYDRTQWVIADNEVLKWPLQGFPTGSAWSLRVYNIGVYQHTLYVRLLVNETQRLNTPLAQLVYIAPGAEATNNEP